MKNLAVGLPCKEISYEIEFSEKFEDLAKNLKKQIGKRNFLIISDENVEKFTPFLKNFNKENVFILPSGEETKHWPFVEKILNKCFDKELDRSSSVLVAIGGGVVGDLTGFTASLYKRGLPVIQIPTSLLAMVDASIGGKTGIDCAYGKNLIGTFHQPERIFCCEEFLETLPLLEIKSGLGEMIKHGILGSEKHFSDLEKIANPKPTAKQVFSLVRDSMEIKARIVEQDEREGGARMQLNLGHTFGHAIELLHNFKFSHGIAVAIGTVMATQYALENGICDEETADRIENIFNKFEIDVTCDLSEKQIWKAMTHDKKVKDGHIRLVLPEKIGKVRIHTV